MRRNTFKAKISAFRNVFLLVVLCNTYLYSQKDSTRFTDSLFEELNPELVLLGSVSDSDSSLDHNKENEGLNFIVFPIPADNKIAINANKNYEKLEIVITSVEGRVVLQKNLQGSEWDLDIYKFDRGTYLIEFILNGNNIEQQKIIKI